MNFFKRFNYSLNKIPSLFLPLDFNDIYIKDLCAFFIANIPSTRVILCSNKTVTNLGIRVEKLFICTHGKKEDSNFRYFEGTSFWIKPYLWFDFGSHKEIDLALFHCCYGSQIINNYIKIGRKLPIKNIVSYNSKIGVIIGDTKIDEYWISIFQSTIKSIKMSKNSFELKAKLKEIYIIHLKKLKQSKSFEFKDQLEGFIAKLFYNINVITNNYE